MFLCLILMSVNIDGTEAGKLAGVKLKFGTHSPLMKITSDSFGALCSTPLKIEDAEPLFFVDNSKNEAAAASVSGLKDLLAARI